MILQTRVANPETSQSSLCTTAPYTPTCSQTLSPYITSGSIGTALAKQLPWRTAIPWCTSHSDSQALNMTSHVLSVSKTWYLLPLTNSRVPTQFCILFSSKETLLKTLTRPNTYESAPQDKSIFASAGEPAWKQARGSERCSTEAWAPQSGSRAHLRHSSELSSDPSSQSGSPSHCHLLGTH